ncbi:MAG: hypothetical protein ACJA1A_001787 [Saprospiraceae bacterium]|jgi:hypothetical protein
MNKFIGAVLVVFIACYNLTGQSDHLQVSFVKAELVKNSIAAKEIYVTDHYTSRGITHTYYKESINGLPVFNSRGAIHYKDKNEIITKHSFRNSKKGNAISINPTLTAFQVLDRLAEIKGYDRSGEEITISTTKGAKQEQIIRAEKISLRDIPVSLEYYYASDNDLRLVWLLPIEELGTAWYTNYLVDANSGEILAEIDWTVECDHGKPNSGEVICRKDHSLDHSPTLNKRSSFAVAPNSYEVYAWPVESPNFGARTSEASPWLDNVTASPNGWHTIGANDYTSTRGNNTDTYLDDDNTNSPTGGDAARADGGATLDFFFPLDVDMDPTLYKEASVTNTFYWTNLMHDVWYNYGFDEASGNFQEENYTANGFGSDYVRSEAQDGSGTCNANFGTPPDGSNPRMQMYLCTKNGNFRDGDYDNGVIAHEYGHGISNRLTGGPAASGCLGNQEQMGEGWSDYLGAVMTIEPGDAGPDARGIGTWLFGEGPEGAGIRPFPYSTDLLVNPMTYDNIKTVSVPHGVGSVWCTMLWDMTWAFIDEYGFDPDIYNGTGGNNKAMQLVMEGMKLQPCSPGFVDGRDAILEADMMLNGGAHQCLIWNAFATRGLGFSANQASTGSRSDGTEAFDLPPSCSLNIKKTTATMTALETDQILFEIIVENNFPAIDLTDILLADTIPQELFLLTASDGATETGGIVTWPLFDLLATEADTFTVLLEVKTGLTYIVSDIYDDIENGVANWATSFSGSTNWSTQTTVFNSSINAWFAPDNSTVGSAFLDLAFEIGIGGGSEISFFHQYDTEASWDGGQVFISTNGGAKWVDLGPNMTNNGYNNLVFNSVPGFSGNSNGFLNTVIDLDSYEGQNVLIRFQMNCDPAVGGNGWWIDDIAITNLKSLTINEAEVSSDVYSASVFANAVQLIPPPTVFQASLIKTDILCPGEANGEILTSPQGGSGNYTYIWNDGATSQNRLSLSGGIYRVTISDGVDDIMKVGIVTEPSAINLFFNVENITNATGDNGSVEVFPSGGTGDFSYLWETGATTAEISNLEEGFYIVTVTDENNCVKIDSAEVIKYSCGDDHYDSGGPSSDYSSNEDRTVVICSDLPDEGVVLTFNSLDIEINWDALYVYNGNSINSPLFDSGNGETQAGYPAGGYYGTSAPGPFTSSNESGCITLRFRSDQVVTGDGWDIDITCTPCAPEVMNLNPDGYGSLKQQILCADPIDVINIGQNVYSDSITLDSTILIDKQLTIDPGVGNDFNIISNEDGPIFIISPVGSLNLNHLTLNSGEINTGAAIINDGILILNNVIVKENQNTPNPESLILNNGTMSVTGNTRIIKE